MTNDEKKEKVLSFIKSQALGVLATVNEQSKPEAALVAISETEDFEFIFGTANTTRKYENIQQNPSVAFVMGLSADEGITVQVEGVAVEVTGSDAELCRDIHVKKNPRSQKFANNPTQRWFKIQPTWIRYTDFKTGEFEIVI